MVSVEGGSEILIENIGSVLAMGGAVFNCSPKREWKRVGFAIWVLSNGLLLYWAYSIQAWYPATMYLFFCGTATYGFVNHKEEK